MPRKISLLVAILTNINVVIGGAFFINAPKISQIAGSYAPLIWIVCATMLFPLAMVFVRFAKRFPTAGNLYLYSKQAFGRLVGFCTGWIYFLGNAAGNLVLVDAFTNLIFAWPMAGQLLLNMGITPKSFAILLVCLFMAISMGGIEVLAKIQMLISAMYLVPMTILVLGLFNFAKLDNLTILPSTSSWFSDSLPMIFLAYIGLELSTSMIHVMEEGKSNIGKATYYSLIIITAIYAIAQLALHLSLGEGSSIAGAFPRLAWLIGNRLSPQLANTLSMSINACMAISFLNGAYAVFFANNWLLHTMAMDLRGPVRFFLLQVSKFDEPKNCILIQGLVTIVILQLAQNSLWIQLAAVVGVLLVYAMTVLAFTKLFDFDSHAKIIITSISSGAILLCIALKEFFATGLLTALPMIFLFSLGVPMYFMDKISAILHLVDKK